MRKSLTEVLTISDYEKDQFSVNLPVYLVEECMEKRKEMHDNGEIEENNKSAMVREALQYYKNANPGDISFSVIMENIRKLMKEHEERYVGEGLLNKKFKEIFIGDGSSE